MPVTRLHPESELNRSHRQYRHSNASKRGYIKTYALTQPHVLFFLPDKDYPQRDVPQFLQIRHPS